jgi:hypothetical protein
MLWKNAPERLAVFHHRQHVIASSEHLIYKKTSGRNDMHADRKLPTENNSIL